MFSFFSKNKKSNSKDSFFIHIPKSGGSTFVGLLQASLKSNKSNTVSNKPTHRTDNVGNTEIFHIDFLDKYRKFKGVDIFKPNNNKFVNKVGFILLRNPIDRLVSEFNFQYHILNGKNGDKKAAILSNLKNNPKTIEEYIENKETHNYQSKFLLGRPINDSKKVSEKEFNNILNTIETSPIHCGITEEYASFLNLFEEKTGKSLSKKVIVRKKTPFVYQSFLNDGIKKRIIELNKFDYELYNLAKSKVTINNKKFKFVETDQFIV